LTEHSSTQGILSISIFIWINQIFSDNFDMIFHSFLSYRNHILPPSLSLSHTHTHTHTHISVAQITRTHSCPTNSL
jgi:hypothetical protein